MKKERIHEILDAVNGDGFLSSRAAALRFQTSEATVRRDFHALAAAGLARRTHGGLRVLESGRNPSVPLALREEWNAPEKRLLARAAAAELPPGCTVMIYGGSTTVYLGEYLPDTVTAVTNLPRLAAQFPIRFPTGAGPRITLIGGALDYRTGNIQGAAALKTVENYHCDIRICSAFGTDDAGLTDIDDECTLLLAAMMRNCRKRIVLLDHTKFRRRGLSRALRWEEIELIFTTRHAENHPLLREIRSRGPEIRVLPPPAETPELSVPPMRPEYL